MAWTPLLFSLLLHYTDLSPYLTKTATQLRDMRIARP
jgi:hypothetical protein